MYLYNSVGIFIKTSKFIFNVFISCFRLLWSLTFIPIIYYTPMLITNIDKIVHVPLYYYLVLGFSNAVNDVSKYKYSCLMN